MVLQTHVWESKKELLFEKNYKINDFQLSSVDVAVPYRSASFFVGLAVVYMTNEFNFCHCQLNIRIFNK